MLFLQENSNLSVDTRCAVSYWMTVTPFFVVVISTTAPLSEYAATLMLANSAWKQ